MVVPGCRLLMAACNWASVETCTTEPVSGRVGALQAFVTAICASNKILGAEHTISPKSAAPKSQRSMGFSFPREVIFAILLGHASLALFETPIPFSLGAFPHLDVSRDAQAYGHKSGEH